MGSCNLWTQCGVQGHSIFRDSWKLWTQEDDHNVSWLSEVQVKEGKYYLPNSVSLWSSQNSASIWQFAQCSNLMTWGLYIKVSLFFGATQQNNSIQNCLVQHYSLFSESSFCYFFHNRVSNVMYQSQPKQMKPQYCEGFTGRFCVVTSYLMYYAVETQTSPLQMCEVPSSLKRSQRQNPKKQRLCQY